MSSFLRLSKRQPNGCRFVPKHPRPFKEKSSKKPAFRLHPLFLLLGVWYCIKGELFLFLLSALVALQHECAHAFAAAKLGYRLHTVVLMPFGAIIDGDLRGISLKDEIFVAVCGPLCNLITAAFFVAIWWLAPTMYAFTDTACYSSLAIALVNLLPAYPLDGGRIFKCLLAKNLLKREIKEQVAERKAEKICRIVTLCFSLLFLGVFSLFCLQKRIQLSMLLFGVFLLFGAFGTADKTAVYDKINVAMRPNLKKGVEIRRVAVSKNCPIKDALRFVSRDSYLVLEVFDEQERHLFDLSQNELSALFSRANTPYETLESLKQGKK